MHMCRYISEFSPSVRGSWGLNWGLQTRWQRLYPPSHLVNPQSNTSSAVIAGLHMHSDFMSHQPYDVGSLVETIHMTILRYRTIARPSRFQNLPIKPETSTRFLNGWGPSAGRLGLKPTASCDLSHKHLPQAGVWGTHSLSCSTNWGRLWNLWKVELGGWEKVRRPGPLMARALVWFLFGMPSVSWSVMMWGVTTINSHPHKHSPSPLWRPPCFPHHENHHVLLPWRPPPWGSVTVWNHEHSKPPSLSCSFQVF